MMEYELFKSTPEGFDYYPDFLSVQEENELLKLILKVELHEFVFQGYAALRKVASFGFNYSFHTGKLTRGKAIPDEFRPFIEKAADIAGEPPDAFQELLITEYPEGSVINWHRDAPPLGLIAGISLLSDCRFRLRPHVNASRNRKAIISFPVKRRSLYVIKGDARDAWQHSIAAVSGKRYSITLRTLRTDGFSASR
jgi:alkylated DNA repair dioxygenase AlkB